MSGSPPQCRAHLLPTADASAHLLIDLDRLCCPALPAQRVAELHAQGRQLLGHLLFAALLLQKRLAPRLESRAQLSLGGGYLPQVQQRAGLIEAELKARLAAHL